MTARKHFTSPMFVQHLGLDVCFTSVLFAKPCGVKDLTHGVAINYLFASWPTVLDPMWFEPVASLNETFIATRLKSFSRLMGCKV